MQPEIVLASSSETRSSLLKNAGIRHKLVAPLIDEEAITAALLQDEIPPRDVADTLADMKAKKIGIRFPCSLIIGCDQVLVFKNKLYSKPKTRTDMKLQLNSMKGKSHELLSAAVIYRQGLPIWRHIGKTRVTLRERSKNFIDAYVRDNWETTKSCVGGYKIETNGVQLVEKIEGDFFNILGMPLLEILNFLDRHEILGK